MFKQIKVNFLYKKEILKLLIVNKNIYEQSKLKIKHFKM